jgi:hypothetical protein
MQRKSVSVSTDHRREARAPGRVRVRVGAVRSRGNLEREVFSIKIGVKLSPPQKKTWQDDFRKNSDKVDPRDIA